MKDVNFEDAKLHEVTSLATCTGSSVKEKHGVCFCLDNNPDTFWRTDGKQPHWIVFRYNRKINFFSLKILFKGMEDESYTPKDVIVSVGPSLRETEMKVIKVYENIDPPDGWADIELTDKNEEDRENNMVRGDFLKIEFLSCHLNGKDIKLRQLKIFEKLRKPSFGRFSVGISIINNNNSKCHLLLNVYGWEAEEGVEKAREQIATLINADKREIIFTSGATESNNLGIKGVAEFYKNRRNHIIALQTEHKCVLDSCRYLESRGFEVTYLPVQKNGLVDLELLEKSILPEKTSIVCSMLINNEIGVRQPIEKIGDLCQKHNIFLHCDAAQGVGKVKIDVKAMNVATMSISGHKIYGPKGIGALFVRRKPRVRLVPLFSGGGQERGLRSGTVPPFLCVGLGKACEMAGENMDVEYDRIKKLSDRLYKGITSQLTHVVLNGESPDRYPGNLNLSFSCVEGESLLIRMKLVAVSSGSACTSESLEPSYVLRALGVSEDMAHTSIRFGIGRFTTEEQVDMVISETVQHVNALREMSPLWEMVNEGIDLNTVQWTTT